MAGIATAYCIVTFGFWKFGRRIREHSKFAVQDDKVETADSAITTAEAV